MHGKALVTVFVAAALFVGGAMSHAQQAVPNAPTDLELARRECASKLDALFASLKKAGSEAEAREFTEEIWRLWNQSGRPDIDAMMARAFGGMQSRDIGLANLLLDEVIEQAPDFAEGWNRRATLRYLTGDNEGSLLDIEKTLALEPRHFGALAGRAMIHAATERWKEAVTDYRAALTVNPFLPERLNVLPMLERKAYGDAKKL